MSDIEIVITGTTGVDENGKIGTDIKVRSEGLETEDELVVLLLTVIEKSTGVSTDPYVELVDRVRRARAGG